MDRRSNLTDRLRGVRERSTAAGRTWDIPCPTHDDDRPSLTVTEKPDGLILLNCKAGCDTAEVVAAMGMTMNDLMPEQRRATNGHHNPEAVYRYTDERGEGIFEVCRYPGKEFKQRHRDDSAPGGYKWGLNGARRVLFRLHELIKVPAGETVFVAEGEKDALALRERGLWATTNPGGASKGRTKWLQEYTDWLRDHLPGRRFVILPDNDEPGLVHAEAVCHSLRHAGLNAMVVQLPGLPEKGDVSDWLKAGGTGEDLLRIVEEKAQGERRWRTIGEMLSRPKPAWRIEGILPENANAVLYGGSGIGKTFVAIDLCFRIAVGSDWHGHPVRQGAIAYLAAEGGYELGIRMQAWMEANEIQVAPPVFTFEDPINVLNAGDVTAFIADLNSLPTKPALLVVDTLALCMPGGDENSGQDMGRYNEACRRIRREAGVQVLTIHHTGRNGDHERGHTSLRGANDVMIEVTSEAGIITMACTKQRNAAKFEPISFSLIPWGDSCILGQPGIAAGNLARVDREMLEALHDCTGHLSRKELGEIAGLADAALTRKLRAMLNQGLIEKEGKAKSKLGGYRLTYNGRELMAKILSRERVADQADQDDQDARASRGKGVDLDQNRVINIPFGAGFRDHDEPLPDQFTVTSRSPALDQDPDPSQARNGGAEGYVDQLDHFSITGRDQHPTPANLISITRSPPFRGDRDDRDRDGPGLIEWEEGDV